MKQFMAIGAVVLIVVLPGAALVAILWWADESSSKHKDNIANKVNIACHGNPPVEIIKNHGAGWWYEILCQNKDGTTYELIVR